jgi:hypothetical protein
MIRTTLGEFLAKPAYEGPGIYVLACYPSLGCIYVGISDNVYVRLRQHLGKPDNLGSFLASVFADACGFRLDIFPHEDREWLIDHERRLIQYFRPMLNEQGLGK